MVSFSAINGVTLGYEAGTGQGEAKATKDGNNWKVSGTATVLTWPTHAAGEQAVRDRGRLPVARHSKSHATAVCRKGAAVVVYVFPASSMRRNSRVARQAAHGMRLQAWLRPRA
jgi:hypothetical protein